MAQKNNDENIANKVAVITGGTRGIGFAIAERLLGEGASVAICGTRQKSVDEALAHWQCPDKCFGLVADVSKFENVSRFAAAVKQRFGAVHILVNNAGAGIFATVGELTPEQWQRTIAVNLNGAYYCSHEFLPMLRQSGGGDVIHISSLAGKNAFTGGAAYNASKFGLNGFSEAMMLDYRNEGLRVSTIMPGSVGTEFGGNQGGQAHVNTDRNAWKIQPEDIAEIVVSVLRMPRRTTVSQIEVRPSRPPAKT